LLGTTGGRFIQPPTFPKQLFSSICSPNISQFFQFSSACLPATPLFDCSSTQGAAYMKMLMCDRGVQMLVTTVGAFAAFSLMTIAVGTDYWLYSRGVCRVKSSGDNDTSRKNEEVMTHSGLWRTCCLEGT
ncbi:hypothetical protein XENOCAPTIV_011695, partial [Xenoophorus captivus]